MTQVFTADYYRGEHYPEYFTTPHWLTFKEVHIYSNPDALCFIDDKKYSLLPHHFSYKKLFHETTLKILLFWIFGDVAIVCFDCHTRIHFIELRLWFFSFTIRVPLNRFLLLLRMFYLKWKYCIQTRQFGKLVLSNLYYYTK
jgi:hypothetical protein